MATLCARGAANAIRCGDSDLHLLPTENINSDLEVLRTHEHTDFTIVCGVVVFAVHRAFLRRNPYFKAVVCGDGRFRETAQRMITIRDFRPFEVDWLIVYIYGGCPMLLEPEAIKNTNPTESFFNTCVRLYTIGDYFLDTRLRDFALQELRFRALMKPKDFTVGNMSKPIPYLSDLEQGIRAAWTLDRNTDATRLPLLDLCRDISPHLARHPSFARLLEEVPAFAADFAKTLLGFPGPGLPRVQKDTVYGQCVVCKLGVVDSSDEAGSSSNTNSGTGTGAETAGSNADTGEAGDNTRDGSEVMLFPASSSAIGSRQQVYICSQKCLKKCSSLIFE